MHIVAIALLLAWAGSAEGQYLHGRVIDRHSGSPVASASVLVVNPDNTIRAGAITDRSGRFNLRTTPGTFRLRVRRVGYAETGSTALELTRADTLDFDIRIALRPRAIEALTISAEAAPLRDPSGFFQRQTQATGRFLGPYEVERRRPTSPADLLNDIPGFHVSPQLGGFRVLMTGRNRRCEPTVYIDGTIAHRGTQTDRLAPEDRDEGVILETLINANAIRAMETYQSGAMAPVRFRPVGAIGGGDCGVIVFWTSAGFGR